MTIRPSFRRVAVLLLVAGLGPWLLAAPASAWVVEAGWTRADVGLHDQGEGIYLGAENSLSWAHPIFDASYGVQYVQKKGSQPTPFSDPFAGFIFQDAEVTLHVVQPSVSLGASVPNLPFVPRVYVGGAIGLKVKESWSDFPGVPDQAYGYKETDGIVHAGLSVAIGPALLDVRWSRSLVGQLLLDNRALPLAPTLKAENPQAGLRVPEVGFDTEVWQVGVGYRF